MIVLYACVVAVLFLIAAVCSMRRTALLLVVPGVCEMATKILNGRELAGYIKERQAHVVRSLFARGVHPTLAIIRDSDSPVIDKYVKLKIRYGEDIGVEVREMQVGESNADDDSDIRKTDEPSNNRDANDTNANHTSALASLIRSANSDSSINSVILQLPIRDQAATEELCDLIDPAKDVDGLGAHAKFDSATATAILWLLSGYNIELSDKKIALVGRGKLVGAPLFKMFTNSGYHVTQFHRGSDLTELRDYDVIITATGVPGLIKSEYISGGSVLVDAGTASEKGEIKGDLDPSLYDRTDLAAITPVIGGVGPLTVTCLFEHVLEACE